MLKYTITFHSNHTYLLKKIIKLKHSLKGDKQLQTINAMDDTTDIRPDVEKASVPVDVFEQIAKKFVPLNVQVFILFLKVFLTGLLLYMWLDSLSNGGNDDVLTSQIQLIITVILPAIAERLCSPSNIKDVAKINEDAIKHMI